VTRALDRPVTLVIALTINNGAILGYHMVTSRVLGPSRYGAVGAVLALTALVQVGTGAVQTAVTHAIASAGGAGPWLIGVPQRRMVGAAAAFVIVGAVLAPGVQRYLHLGSAVPIAAMLAFGAFVIVGLIPRGVLLGERRFGLVAAATVSGAILRLSIGTVAASWFGVNGAVAAVAGGEAVAAAIVVVGVARRGTALQATPRPLVLGRSALGLAIAAYAGLWLFTGTDVFLARHLLASRSAGLYVAASTAASAALFLPYNVTSAAFPGIAAEAAAGTATTFLRSVRLVAVLIVGAALVLMVVPNLAIAVLFGHSYRGAGAILVLLAVSNGAQGAIGFFQLHQLAHHRITALIPWLGLVALAFAADISHRGPTRIATEALITSVAVLVMMASYSWRLEAQARSAAADRDR